MTVKVSAMKKLLATVALGGALVLSGCAQEKPDALSDECAKAVAARMMDGRDSDITDADIDRYFDEECD